MFLECNNNVHIAHVIEVWIKKIKVIKRFTE